MARKPLVLCIEVAKGGYETMKNFVQRLGPPESIESMGGYKSQWWLIRPFISLAVLSIVGVDLTTAVLKDA